MRRGPQTVTFRTAVSLALTLLDLSDGAELTVSICETPPDQVPQCPRDPAAYLENRKSVLYPTARS